MSPFYVIIKKLFKKYILKINISVTSFEFGKK